MKNDRHPLVWRDDPDGKFASAARFRYEEAIQEGRVRLTN